MTIAEKETLRTKTFDELWESIWGGSTILSQYKNEEITSKEKFNNLKEGVSYNNKLFTLNDLINESNQQFLWEETEWGFSKREKKP